MVYRYSWIAGAGALLFVLYQLNGLLRPTIEGPPWQLVVVAALILGVVITWAALSYRMPTWMVILINAVAAVIAIGRVSAPETTVGLLPTAATLTQLDAQMEQALAIVRNGVEPVIPVAGLIVMLLVLFWVVGFLFAWGLSKGRPYVALLPPLVIALQFATMDRHSTSVWRAGIFVALVAAGLFAIRYDQRVQTSGRMVPVGQFARTESFLSRSAGGLMAAIVAATMVAVTTLGALVPSDGVVDWRSPTGLTGEFFGSVSYNPFVSIQQSLVSNSNTPVFGVRVLDGDVPADQIYFSLLTMETYNGGQFSANRPEVVQMEEDQWQNPAHAFAGPVEPVVADVEIFRLQMEWLPSPYQAVDFAAEERIERSMRVRVEDAALRFEGGFSYDGMRYQVRSDIPDPDVSVLATDSDGTLSPAFELASQSAEDVPEPVTAAVRPEPPDVERYLQLPDDFDPAIGALARTQTRNLSTSFEKAIALESWFRSPAFAYSIDIEPGHGATDLAAWLLDEESPNHRIGYCENFATAMAVMARTLGIPSRVVLGFTPGTPQADGTIIVRDRNAHAWVELWMPTQGWVRFDPTPRRDRINPTTFEEVETALGFPITNYLDVPDPEELDVNVVVPNRPADPFEDPVAFPPVGGGELQQDRGFQIPEWVTTAAPWLAAAALVLGGIPLAKWWRRRRRLRKLRSGDISAAWDEIVSQLDDLGRAPRASDTPTEVAAQVDPAMAPLATVYGRSLYGGTDTLDKAHLDTATKSLLQTEERLTTRHSRFERVRAKYRLGTLLPGWMRRRKRR